MIILTNDESSLPAALMYKILDRYLAKDEEEKDWAALYLNFSKRYEDRLKAEREEVINARTKGTQPTLKLDEYVGVYEDVMYGKATITKEKKMLKVVFEPAKELFYSDMTHWENDVFQIKFKDQFLPEGYIKFNVENGKSNGFTIELPNPDFHFYHLNFKKVN